MEELSKKLEILLEKSEWSHEECAWILDYLDHSEATELRDIMQRMYAGHPENAVLPDKMVSERILQNIYKAIETPEKESKPKLVPMWVYRLSAAACIIGLLIGSIYLFRKNDSSGPIAKNTSTQHTYKTDVAPGGNKAILTLANGSAIILDSAQNGALAKQGNTTITKLNGKLNYTAAVAANNEILYNTITTPRGGQYQVQLPDGSEVWLNAASSLHFPTAFVGKERRVEITGEAYFEVAKNASMPFIVSVNGAEVQVLGTHFNVMAYKDENVIKTTLLEGAVKFTKDANTTALKPGQQSQLTADGKIKVLDGVNTDAVVAWKNGYFNFENADIETVMRQLSRWYDVEVVYNGKTDEHFYASPPRSIKLSDILKALELTGKVKFEIKDKKIIVMP